MSSSFTVSSSSTFTVTHARHLAAKVKTDLKRMQRFYHNPSDAMLDKYETELTELLKHGYLDTASYGFKRNDQFIEPTLKYTAQELGGMGDDDDPGKVKPGANVQGATFYSYVTYSRAWDALSSDEQRRFKSNLPFQRTGADEPTTAGYYVSDNNYTSGGRTLGRQTIRSF
jgi:hypothetical protein